MTIKEQIPINHPIMRMVMDTTTTMVMDTTTTMVMDTTTTTTMVMDTMIRIELLKYFQLIKYQNLEIDGGNGLLA
jgi:hypothetical protein